MEDFHQVRFHPRPLPAARITTVSSLKVSFLPKPLTGLILSL
jgi:hypothetical protein